MAQLFRANRVGDGLVYRANAYYPPAKQLMFRPMRRNGVAIFNYETPEPVIRPPAVFDAAVSFGFAFGVSTADVRDYEESVEFGITFDLETTGSTGFSGEIAVPLIFEVTAGAQMTMSVEVEVGVDFEMTSKGRIAGWDDEPPRGPPDWVPDPKPRLY